MENKYFTPDIEDIRVGYKCQVLWCCKEPRPWNNIKVTKEDYLNTTSLPIEEIISRLQYDVVEIRTPYLTKEQIEAEGWVFTNRFEGGSADRFEENFKKDFPNGYYALTINQFQFVTIRLWNCINPKEPISQTHWRGILPSINEFRTICKLLKIT